MMDRFGYVDDGAREPRTCATPGCNKPLPPDARTGRRRAFCSDECRDYGEEVKPTREPLAKTPVRQLEPGACARCKRERWLYSRVEGDDALCAVCITRATRAPADREHRAASESATG